MENSQKQSDREMQREAKGCRERPRAIQKEIESHRHRLILTQKHIQVTEAETEGERCREALRYVERAPHTHSNTSGFQQPLGLRASAASQGLIQSQGYFPKGKEVV